MIGAKLIEAAGNGISTVAVAEAIDFDGTNDYLRRTSNLTGNINSKTFTFSCWVWNAGDANDRIIYNVDNGSLYRVRIEVSSTTITVNAFNSAGTQILSFTVSLTSTYTFYNLLISVDMTSGSNCYVYVNDVAQTKTITTYTNDLINFSQTYHAVGTFDGGSTYKYKGRLSNVYLDYTYRDLTVTANRRLFVTADLKPAAGQAALNPIMYLTMADPTQPGKNSGTGGDFTLTGTVARSGRGPNQYNAPYSDLDGSADYLNRTSIVGIADGKQFTVSCCFNSDSTDAGFMFNMRTTSLFNSFAVRLNTNNCLTVSAQNAAGTTILSVSTANNSIVAGRNYVITVSCDLTDTSKRWLYLNGEAVSATWSTYTNDTIDFTIPNYYVGLAATPTSGIFNGRLGALWFNTSYIDLSVASNLAKFVTGTGIDAKPVDLGASGELPTGTSPLIYLPMYGNNAGKNYGTGGDFTVNSGPYTGARGPNEFWGNKANITTATSGLRTTTGVGISNGGAFSVSCSFNIPTSGTNTRLLYASNASSAWRLDVYIDTSGTLNLLGRNASGTTRLSATSQSAITYNANQFLQICVDLSDAGARSVYINGNAFAMTWNVYANDALELSSTYFGVGCIANSSGVPGGGLTGTLSEFYFTTDYIDFSQEANRLKFRDCFGNPTDLPSAITAQSVPNPAIYMRFPPTSFGTNSGTGGDFTVNGTITDGGQL